MTQIVPKMAKASFLPSSVRSPTGRAPSGTPFAQGPGGEGTGSQSESGAGQAGGEVLGVRKRKKATDVGGL